MTVSSEPAAGEADAESAGCRPAVAVAVAGVEAVTLPRAPPARVGVTGQVVPSAVAWLGGVTDS